MKRTVTLLILVMLFGAASAQRSSTADKQPLGQQALAYSLQNRVGLAVAATAVGADIFDLGKDLGYGDDVFDFFDAVMDASLLQATCWSLWPVLSGSAEDQVGLTTGRLTSLFRLRMANGASFLPECPDDIPENKSYLSFMLSVWTVGDSYPVAYLFELTGNIYPTYEGSPTDPVDSRWLGYAEASGVDDQLQDALSIAVEQFALRYLHIARYR